MDLAGYAIVAIAIVMAAAFLARRGTDPAAAARAMEGLAQHEEAEAQLRARQNPYTDQDVQAAQAGVDQAQAAVEMAQLGVRETQVVAPVAACSARAAGEWSRCVWVTRMWVTSSPVSPASNAATSASTKAIIPITMAVSDGAAGFGRRMTQLMAKSAVTTTLISPCSKPIRFARVPLSSAHQSAAPNSAAHKPPSTPAAISQ